MFIISLLTSLYTLLCLMIIFLVLVQRGKGGMGIGNMGGGNQRLFGSSGGQDLFQKATWVMCALLLSGALIIGVLKTKYRGNSISYTRESAEAVQPEEAADQSDNL